MGRKFRCGFAQLVFSCGDKLRGRRGLRGKPNDNETKDRAI